MIEDREFESCRLKFGSHKVAQAEKVRSWVLVLASELSPCIIIKAAARGLVVGDRVVLCSFVFVGGSHDEGPGSRAMGGHLF